MFKSIPDFLSHVQACIRKKKSVKLKKLIYVTGLKSKTNAQIKKYIYSVLILYMILKQKVHTNMGLQMIRFQDTRCCCTKIVFSQIS